MAANNTANYQRIVDKQFEFGKLFKRMDLDQKLAILDPYEMKQLDGQKTPDVINVTMNEARVFLDRSTAIMNGANMQRVVKGRKLDDSQTTTIENFYDDFHYSNDEILIHTIYTTLYGFLIQQLLGRGACVGRCLMREEGDKLRPDVTGWDARYFVYENDSTAMIWGAAWNTQSKAQIERDYGIDIRGKHAVVTDRWDDEINEIYIGGQLYTGGSQAKDPDKHPERMRKHGLGYVPYVHMKSGAGLQSFMDAGIMEFQGESIFANNRGLLPELNRAASIFQTLTAMTFEGSYQLENSEGMEMTKPDNPMTLYRKLLPVEMGGGYRLIPINDVKNATRLFYNMLVGALQRGGLPNIDYGGLSFPLSAVAISKLTGSKDAIFIPRLNALAYFYRALSHMIKDQYLKGGYTADLGELGMERTYTSADLDHRFSTEYEFYSTSPEQDIANYAIGAQAMAIGMSRHTVFSDVLRLKNPTGEIMKSREEKVEAGDIAQTLYAAGHEQISKGKDIQAEMTLQQLELVLRQRAQGQDTGLAPQRGGIPAGAESIKPMVDLFDSGGGGGTPPGQDEPLPEGEEGDNRQQRREEVTARSRENA